MPFHSGVSLDETNSDLDKVSNIFSRRHRNGLQKGIAGKLERLIEDQNSWQYRVEGVRSKSE